MSDLPIEKINLTANTIRALSMDAVQRANNGHPGMPMGTADLATVLWSQFLKHDPADATWPDRDRFILSAGHGSMLIYSLLHLSGYDVSIDDIKNFREWGSNTPGHPEYGHTHGVETTTGPLGQGITNAVGFALAEAHLAAKFNRDGHTIVDHFTYVIASDGDLQEGISHEACALAGVMELNKLIVLYDDNDITIDGDASKAMLESVPKRFDAYGWHVMSVDGHDPSAVARAIETAKSISTKPSLIACKTVIGKGSPNKGGKASSHGSPLGDDEIALVREQIGWTLPPFEVPDDAYALMKGAAATDARADWQKRFEAYRSAHPELADEFKTAVSGDLPQGWTEHLPSFPTGESVATRNASGAVLKAITPHLPTLVGGSADLTGSNKTYADALGTLTPGSLENRYIHYGIREHGMAGIMNGMSLHGGIRPYGGTFLVFSDYMRGSMRLSALMHQPVVYVLTHDSIGLGADGPTHQPVEHLMALRSIPNMSVFRPADANETAVAWQYALEHKEGPTSLILTRQGLETLEGDTNQAIKGGYVLRDSDNPQAIIFASGSEVKIAIDAYDQLAKAGVAARVVSMPCWEAFEAQDEAYKQAVLLPNVKARVAIEAGATQGWYKYVGMTGRVIGLDHFGASAPYKIIYENFGITPSAVAEAVKQQL